MKPMGYETACAPAELFVCADVWRNVTSEGNRINDGKPAEILAQRSDVLIITTAGKREFVCAVLMYDDDGEHECLHTLLPLAINECVYPIRGVKITEGIGNI